MTMNADEARRLLTRCGYDTGGLEPGGLWGWLAWTACAAFQLRFGLPMTGQVDLRTAAALRRATRRGSRQPSTRAGPPHLISESGGDQWRPLQSSK